MFLSTPLCRGSGKAAFIKGINFEKKTTINQGRHASEHLQTSFLYHKNRPPDTNLEGNLPPVFFKFLWAGLKSIGSTADKNPDYG